MVKRSVCTSKKRRKYAGLYRCSFSLLQIGLRAGHRPRTWHKQAMCRGYKQAMSRGCKGDGHVCVKVFGFVICPAFSCSACSQSRAIVLLLSENRTRPTSRGFLTED